MFHVPKRTFEFHIHNHSFVCATWKSINARAERDLKTVKYRINFPSSLCCAYEIAGDDQLFVSLLMTNLGAPAIVAFFKKKLKRFFLCGGLKDTSWSLKASYLLMRDSREVSLKSTTRKIPGRLITALAKDSKKPSIFIPGTKLKDAPSASFQPRIWFFTSSGMMKTLLLKQIIDFSWFFLEKHKVFSRRHTWERRF